jgi:amino acid transporter
MVQRLKKLLLGQEKNPLDPGIFHKLALVAFLAWVGIGADGLSSANYGPEEAFLALGTHKYLAIFLAIATAATVFIIALGYSQIIELFPQGGGGYLVTTRLLGRYPGLVAGSALVVDYVLTISISIAACGDALFSFLPVSYQVYKFHMEIFLLCMLVYMNLRGAKESIMILMPIFLTFIASHGIFLGVVFFKQIPVMGEVMRTQSANFTSEISTLGVLPLLLIFLRAYGLGAGTYTGIEAVSNSMHMLKEPKIETGRKTMMYMAISLSLLAGALLLAYLLMDIHPEEGRTLNATLVHSVTSGWNFTGLPLGQIFSTVTLLSASALLFVAAQAGFMGGPGVLSYLAMDSWVPKRFLHLSDRLVTKNGVLVMGIAAMALLIYAKGSVRVLVVMYAVNVFIDFSLSLTGITLHRLKAKGRAWVWKALNTATGACLTFAILCTMVYVKFIEGAWVTVVITGTFVVHCLLINRHYTRVQKALRRLDETLSNIPFPSKSGEKPKRDHDGATAAILVRGFNGLGIHSLMAIKQLFRDHFKNYVFVSVGVIDSAKFKGVDMIEALRQDTEESLEQYKTLTDQMGMYSEYRYALGTHPIDELVTLAKDVVRDFKHVVFFGGQLVFQEETIFSRILHNQTTVFLQKRFRFSGLPMVVLPIRVK